MKDPKGPTKPYRSPEEIAKKHKVPLDTIIRQVKMGTKVEGEHTTSKSGARITALQHVDELPDYYTKLKKVEKTKPMKEETTPEEQYKKDTKYCLLCKKNEKREECSWGPSMWDKYSIAKIHPANESKIHEDHKEIASGKKKDEEGYMARVEFDQIERAVNILRKHIKKGDQQIPAWVQSKITRAADFIDTAAEYMQSDEDISEGLDKRFGSMRKRGGRSAPADQRSIGGEANRKNKDYWADEGGPNRDRGAGNKAKRRASALTKEEMLTFEEFMTEVAAWQRREGKNKEGGLNEKGRKSYERENPGSDLKAPSKKVGNSRRASFCARMSGMKRKLTSSKTARDPDSRINKSLRAWNC